MREAREDGRRCEATDWESLELFEGEVSELIHILCVSFLACCELDIVRFDFTDGGLVDGLTLCKLITVVALAESGCVSGECWECRYSSPSRISEK